MLIEIKKVELVVQQRNKNRDRTMKINLSDLKKELNRTS